MKRFLLVALLVVLGVAALYGNEPTIESTVYCISCFCEEQCKELHGIPVFTFWFMSTTPAECTSHIFFQGYQQHPAGEGGVEVPWCEWEIEEENQFFNECYSDCADNPGFPSV